MKRLLIALWFGGLALLCGAATRTASVSGNWASTTTWGGNPAPVSGDDALINGDVIVTIPSSTSAAAHTVQWAVTANSTGTATLIINGTLTIDAGGYLQVGRTSGQEGKLTFGAGGALISPTEIDFNCCYIDSTATQANPFRLTGAGYIDIGYVAGARMDINVANVLFLLTGQVKFNPGNTTGVATSRVVFSHCTFVGSNGVTFGSSTLPNTATVSITDCDFREFASIKDITIQRAAGGVATFEFLRNTLSQVISGVNYMAIKPKTSTGLTIDGCVMYNGCVITESPGGVTITNNMIAAPTVAPASLDAANSSTFSRNYLPSIADNSGGVNTTGTAGSGTFTIENNVMDGVVNGSWTGRPDFYLPNATPLPSNYRYNLIIGSGEQVIGYNAPNWQTLNHKNNTTGATVSPAVDYGGFLFFCENTVNGTGTINLANNLYRGNGDTSGNATISGIYPGGGTPQTITYSDYNAFYATLTKYEADNTHLLISTGNTAKTVPGSHDTLTNPQFFDATRNLGTWNKYFGTGTTSYTDALNYLLTINGYRGSPNYDQSGSVAAYLPGDVLDWVRYGFSPTNLVLRGAGDPSDGSPDVGAMAVRTIAGTFF